MIIKSSSAKLHIGFILAFCILTFLGCKSFEKYQDHLKFKKEVEDMLTYPDLVASE